MNRVPQILFAALIGVSTANAILIVRHIQARREIRAELRGPTAIPPLSGFTLDGIRWNSQDASCHLLRMTADDCPHCKADELRYTQLLEHAHRSRCELIEMSPRYRDIAVKASRGVIQLGHVNVDLGSAMLPFVTPHTILLDGNWSVKWHHRGELNNESLQRAVSTLSALQDNDPRDAATPMRSVSDLQRDY